MDWRNALMGGVAIASALVGFKVLKSYKGAESFNGMTLNEWLDEIDRIKSTKEPFYYANEFLGSPKYGNGIDSFWEQGWSPQGILHVWKYYDNDTRYFEKSRAWKKMSAESFTAEEIILTADLWENEPHEKNWGIYDNDDDCVGEIVLTYNCYDSYSMTHGNTPYRESRKVYHFTIYADVDIEWEEDGNKYSTIKSALKAFTKKYIEYKGMDAESHDFSQKSAESFNAEDETKYTMYGKEYFEKHDEGKNAHKYYALFKIDKEGIPITYWSAYGRLGGYGRAGSIVVAQLNINKYEEMFSKKYNKYDYLGSTIPAEIEVNAIQKINEKWSQMRLGMKKKKTPPKSPPKGTDARKARLKKRFGFSAEGEFPNKDNIIAGLNPNREQKMCDSCGELIDFINVYEWDDETRTYLLIGSDDIEYGAGHDWEELTHNENGYPYISIVEIIDGLPHYGATGYHTIGWEDDLRYKGELVNWIIDGGLHEIGNEAHEIFGKMKDNPRKARLKKRFGFGAEEDIKVSNETEDYIFIDVKGSQDKSYLIMVNKDNKGKNPISCGCKGYYFGKKRQKQGKDRCKHITMVKEFMKEKGGPHFQEWIKNEEKPHLKGFGAESLAVIDNCLKCKYKGIQAYHIKDMGWWLHCPKCDYRTEIKEGQIAWEVSPDWDKEGKMPSIAPIDVDWACEFIKKAKLVKNFGAEMFDTRLGKGSFGEVYLYDGKALKIVDLEKADNRLQADFFEKIYLMNQKGMKTPDSLVKIIHYNRGTITPELHDELEGNSKLDRKPVGSPIAIWVMELVPTIYRDISMDILMEHDGEYKDEMRELNKWTEKNLNYQIGDLHDENIGIREDDSLVVFDPHINHVGDYRRFGFIHVAETNE